MDAAPSGDPAGRSGGPVQAWSPGLVLLIGGAATVVVLSGLKAASAFVGPALLALVLTVGVSPLRAWLDRRGAPFLVCVAVPLTTVIFLLLALGTGLALSAAQFAALLPGYSEEFTGLVDSATETFARFGVDERRIRDALTHLDPAQVFGFVQSFLEGLLSASSALLLIVLMLFGMCLDATGMARQLDRIAPQRPALVAALRGFARDTCRYLVVSTAFGLIVAVLDTIALYAFGVPAPLLWGLLAFLTNYIPNVGFLIGLAPPAVLGLLDGGVATMIWIIVAYCVLNFVLQSLVQPKYLGDAVGLSFTLVTLSLIVWAWALGPLGAILAVPLSTLARALLIDIDPSKRWLAGLLSSAVDRPGGAEEPADAGPDRTDEPAQPAEPTDPEDGPGPGEGS